MSFAKIPDCLKNHAQWVLWKAENDTKVPYRPSGSKASKTNPEHLSAFATVAAAAERFSGIGFVFTPDDPFVGIDLDGCRNPVSGEIDDWARGVVEGINSYTEVSPSETGLKIIALGSSPFDGGRNISLAMDNRHGKRPGIEVYDRGAYFCVTGRRVRGFDEVREVDPELLKSLVESLPAKQKPLVVGTSTVAERAARYVATIPPAISGQAGHNQTFHVACVLVLGFCMRPDDAYPILAEYNNRCEPPWSEKDLWHKLNSADKQRGERGYLRDARDDEWQNVVIPSYREKKNEEREAKRKPVTIVPVRDNVNQLIDSLSEETHAIKYSTGLPTLDERLQGGLALGSHVVFGARNGECKTMFGLQLVYELSLQGLNALVISEEMSPDKIAKRAIQFASDVAIEEWHVRKDVVRAHANRHFDERAGIYAIYRAKHVANAIEAIKKAREELGVQVVLVDYLQRLEAPGHNPFAVVSNASTALADVAHDTGVMMICLCQVGRESAKFTRQKTTGKQSPNLEECIPTKSDLKQSGRIEEDADVVLMGFRVQAVIHNHPYPNDYLIRVEKNRDDKENNRPVPCTFNGARCRIAERHTKVTFDSELASGKDDDYEFEAF